jgi:hypothetical protein
VPLELASGLGSDLLTITHAGEQLRRLAPGNGSDDGLRSQVVARFSASPVRDVAALAADVRADVVVVPEPQEDADIAAVDLPDVGEAALVVVRPAAAVRAAGQPFPAVHVLLDGSGAGRAAARLAGRLALNLDAPIAVGVSGDTDRRTRKRAAATVQALRGLGLDATELGGPGGSEPGLLMLPEGAAVPPTAASTTVVRVRPAASDEDENLQQALARIHRAALTHAGG